MPYLDSEMAFKASASAAEAMARDLAELTTSALGKVYEDSCMQEMQRERPYGAERGSSRPPSPPSSGTTTPTLTIAPCPDRLWPFMPPPQYGVVEDYRIFRSSYPLDRNMEFIKSLEINSILTLVDTEATPGYLQWLEDFHIKQCKVTVAPNKEGKKGKEASATSIESICEALIFAMDATNQPLWIHCNQGRHRTGCVVACLRKIQGVPIDEVIEEYVAYASPKERPGDVAFIEAFDPSAVFTYARKCGLIGGPDAVIKPTGAMPIANVYELWQVLAGRDRADTPNETDTDLAIESLSSAISEASLGEPMELESKDEDICIDPRLLVNGRDANESAQVGVSITEVKEDGVQRGGEFWCRREEPERLTLMQNAGHSSAEAER